MDPMGNKRMWNGALALVLLLLSLTGWADATLLDELPGKPRLIVLSDIGNEPDDQMSLVCLLLYANELDIEGLVATTSTWQRDKTQPEIMQRIVRAYAEVLLKLRQHADGWIDSHKLAASVVSGTPQYGLEGVSQSGLSSGAELILRRLEAQDPRPHWISIWGGANTLAEALFHAERNLTPEALERLIGRLRVYSISDQDDAGPELRRRFPKLFYIVSPTTPNGEEYARSTWTGIAGDLYYLNGAGADTSLITNEWLDAHIRGQGPLSAHYSSYLFIMEGDTPSFLHLINNGLASHQNPSWGGWGGRYVYRQPYGETRNIWTQGGDLFARVTSRDTVRGVDGAMHTSDQATIWRWRDAFQFDFAARMRWTITDRSEANHAPDVMVNGDGTSAPLYIDLTVGNAVQLSAEGTSDPDGDDLLFRWFHYPEAGFRPGEDLAEIDLVGVDLPQVQVRALDACRGVWLPEYQQCDGQGEAHVILAVTDQGVPAMTRYRRIIVRVSEPALEEGSNLSSLESLTRDTSFAGDKGCGL